jgi:Tfp pilus assembly protein PilV
MTDLRRRIGQFTPRAEAGFTVIEVVVAAVLLAISVLAVLGLVDAASRNNYRAEQTQVVSDRLQQEMEAIKQLPYSQVALTAGPVPSGNPANPNSRVSGTQFNVNRTGSASTWNLVYNGGHSNETGNSVGGGTIAPGPTPFQSGNVHGQIYRYVVWEPEANCANCAHNPNSDLYNGQRAEWFKHVVVAISLDQTASGGTRAYQEVQGEIGNPDQGLGTGSGGGTSNNTAQPWTFWLTDTPCNFSSRQALAGDHLTHNTLGRCSDGVQTGGTAGAPDLMLTQAGPFENLPDSQQPLYDYATDVEPLQNADQDKGLQEKIPANAIGSGSCLTDISSSTSLQTLGTTPQFYLHKWLSPQVPSGSGTIALDGSGELDLWTQTINGATNPGKICIWLFARATSGSTVTDTLAVDKSSGNPYFVYSNAPCPPTCWPSSAWTELHVPLSFQTASGGSVQIPEGSRLGIAIGVERQGTLPGDGLQFMYDHPTYDSRVSVDTHSSLPF